MNRPGLILKLGLLVKLVAGGGFAPIPPHALISMATEAAKHDLDRYPAWTSDTHPSSTCPITIPTFATQNLIAVQHALYMRFIGSCTKLLGDRC